MGFSSVLPNFFSFMRVGPLPDRVRYQRRYSPNDIKGEATVIDTISPGRKGGVKFRGTWWSARCPQAIALDPGTFVRVVGRQGIALLVEPVSLPS